MGMLRSYIEGGWVTGTPDLYPNRKVTQRHRHILILISAVEEIGRLINLETLRRIYTCRP